MQCRNIKKWAYYNDNTAVLGGHQYRYEASKKWAYYTAIPHYFYNENSMS